MEQRGLQSGSPALQLLRVAASCISKCALSAGALGRNCHLLPHCQPRRSYASFADSQPPALITRLDSLPGAARPVPAHRSPWPGCAACRRGLELGHPVQIPCLHPSLPAGYEPPSAAKSCSRGPLLRHPTACTPLGWFWAAAEGLAGAGRASTWHCPIHRPAVMPGGASGLAASPGIPLGITPPRDARSLLHSLGFPQASWACSHPRGEREPGLPPRRQRRLGRAAH